MKTNICIHCKTRHRNNGLDNKIQPACFNCQFIIDTLQASVDAINQWTPITTGKNNRQLIIKEFYIIKK